MAVEAAPEVEELREIEECSHRGDVGVRVPFDLDGLGPDEGRARPFFGLTGGFGIVILCGCDGAFHFLLLLFQTQRIRGAVAFFTLNFHHLLGAVMIVKKTWKSQCFFEKPLFNCSF